jgi:hypothetical protein
MPDLVVFLTIHTSNEYWVGHLPDTCIHQWISGQQSPWPQYTPVPMNIRSAIPLTPVYTNEYSVGHPPDPFIQPMNIQLVIRLTHSYIQWIFSRSSAWPIHTSNEYSVSNSPDTCIHQWIFGQQSAWPTHTPNEYSVGNPPDPCVHQQIFSWQSAWHLYSPMNIRSAICLTCALHQWILGRKSAWPMYNTNEYSVCNPPDTSIHGMNIGSVIHLTHVYAEWIFG